MTQAIDRFRAKWSRGPGDCWLWTGAKNRDGYGSFWSGEYRFGDYRRGPIMVLAHRWSYEHYEGLVPEGVNVLHRCDVPNCVNPEHLFLGTQADNVRDCAQKGRRNQGRPGRHVFQKLSAKVHAEIRARYRAGGVTYRELADEFGVRPQTVGYIVRRGQR